MEDLVLAHHEITWQNKIKLLDYLIFILQLGLIQTSQIIRQKANLCETRLKYHGNTPCSFIPRLSCVSIYSRNAYIPHMKKKNIKHTNYSIWIL